MFSSEIQLLCFVPVSKRERNVNSIAVSARQGLEIQISIGKGKRECWEQSHMGKEWISRIILTPNASIHKLCLTTE